MLRYASSLLVLTMVATPASGAEAEGPELEDIIVTADRADSFAADLVQVGTFRNARIIDVPLTVNVVPDAVIKAQAVTGLYEALRNTAGVTRSQLNGATYDNIAIRGILVENRTSYRLNGSLPTINLVDLPLENKDRVEVLKGVGALYYGFAPPSGIINMVTKRADRNVATAEARVDTEGGTRVAVDFGHRFGDSFGLRFNGSAGIVQPGFDRTDGDRYVAALAADWQIAQSLSARFDIEHVAKDVTEPVAIQLPAAVAGVITLPPLLSNRANLGDRWLRYDAFATNILGRLDWKISESVALTVEGGRALTVRNRDFAQFEGFTPVTGAGTLRLFQTRDQRYSNDNIRAELAAAFATGPIEHHLVAGATSNWRFQNGRANRVTTIAQNYFTPRRLTQLAPVDAATLAVAPLNVRDRGAYVLNRMELGPVQVLAGVRYSDYRSITTSATGAQTRFQLNRWTPSVGLIVKPADKISVYATFLEGLEEGGFAPASAANANSVLPPAVSRQYEAGVKGEIGGLILQLAGFQVDRPSAFTDPTDNVFKLAGQARYRGVEASLTGEVTSHFSLYASAQYLDAQVRRAVQAALQGRRPENTPQWTASLFGEYRLGRLALGAGAFYVGNRAVNGLNQAFVPGYVLFNASARYRVSESLDLQINVENLADRTYWSAAGNNLLGLGQARQARLTARVRL